MADFLTSIGDMLGLNKGKATSSAATSNMSLIDQLGQTAGDPLRQAQGGSQSLIDLFKPGAQLYSDALGVNGDAGNARAGDAFTHSPGYQQALDEGTQQILRTQGARGDLGGGGTGIDLMKYGVGEANKDWGSWLSNLGGYNSLLGNATAANTGNLGNLAQLQEDITSGKVGANNMSAAGAEAGQGSLWDLLGNVAGVAGSAFGLNKNPGGTAAPAAPVPPRGFGGYGSF